MSKVYKDRLAKYDPTRPTFRCAWGACPNARAERCHVYCNEHHDKICPPRHNYSVGRRRK